MQNSPLALRMCGKHTKKTWTLEDGLTLFPDITFGNILKRHKDIMKNPVAAAEVFDVVIKAFFSVVMGITLDHF